MVLLHELILMDICLGVSGSERSAGQHSIIQTEVSKSHGYSVIMLYFINQITFVHLLDLPGVKMQAGFLFRDHG